MVTVLTINELASMRQLTHFILKENGYFVVQACNYEEASRMANAIKFDLVIVEASSVDLDELTLLRALRVLPEYGVTPFILLTSGHKTYKAPALTSLYVKPLEQERLISTVELALA